MALGYDGKLFILAFDHRGSFQKKMFGIQGDPDDEQTQTIADAKHLIWEGMQAASEKGLDQQASGVLVDEQFGGPRNIPGEAKERGFKLAMPVEKSGQDEFDFEYGDDFGAHIEKFDPDFSKVLVRYNPDGDAEMNERQLGRLKELADWLRERGRKFLFELLVPAEPIARPFEFAVSWTLRRSSRSWSPASRVFLHGVVEISSTDSMSSGLTSPSPPYSSRSASIELDSASVRSSRIISSSSIPSV